MEPTPNASIDCNQSHCRPMCCHQSLVGSHVRRRRRARARIKHCHLRFLLPPAVPLDLRFAEAFVFALAASMNQNQTRATACVNQWGAHRRSSYG